MPFRFQFRRYRLPFRAVVRTAHGPWAEREGVVVRLEDAVTGRVGWGEAAPIAWFGTETVEADEAVCRALGEWVESEVLATLPHNVPCLRNAIAAARAEIGAATMEGRGRDADEASDYRAVAALLPAGRAALTQIGSKADAGFRVFKWKVGVGDVADELGLLDDVCAALPSGAKLRLDANGAWDRRQAERWLERCADRAVEFVEQPCLAAANESETQRRRTDDVLLGLAADYPTPLALDESLVNDGDVERWLAAGWPGVFVVKPSLLADVDDALEKLARARATVVFSSALETAVGAKSALCAAWRWPGERRALGFGVWPLFADSRFDGPAGAPFVRGEDIERIDAEAIWNVLR